MMIRPKKTKDVIADDSVSLSMSMTNIGMAVTFKKIEMTDVAVSLIAFSHGRSEKSNNHSYSDFPYQPVS